MRPERQYARFNPVTSNMDALGIIRCVRSTISQFISSLHLHSKLHYLLSSSSLCTTHLKPLLYISSSGSSTILLISYGLISISSSTTSPTTSSQSIFSISQVSRQCQTFACILCSTDNHSDQLCPPEIPSTQPPSVVFRLTISLLSSVSALECDPNS